MKRKNLYKYVKWFVLRKAKGRCVYCKCSLSSGFQVDHVVALKLGGADDVGNFVAACRKCNSIKRAKTIDEFVEYLPEEHQSRVLLMAASMPKMRLRRIREFDIFEDWCWKVLWHRRACYSHHEDYGVEGCTWCDGGKHPI